MVSVQAGKQRKSVTDALGRLAQVYEAPNDPSYNYLTSYSYDTLDNLTSVSQGAQTRTFAYDSLKRLTLATNPESGTINYQYDSNGNLAIKTDARGVSAHYAYDALNRVARRWYNGSDSAANTVNNNPALPAGVAPSDEVNFYYDAASLPSGAPAAFERGSATGRLVAVTYGGASAGTYRGYDPLGRVVRQIQQTDSVNYLVEASYNLAGSLTGETYPSVPGSSDRRSVNLSYDAAARLSSLNSNPTSYAPGAAMSGITYAAHGAVASELYGNNLTHTISYNNRLQPSEIKLGVGGSRTPPPAPFHLTYNYGTTDNNGNVQSVAYSDDQFGFSYSQSFTYDSLNRLATATETAAGNTSWSQTNAYDRYGNRGIDLGGGNQSLSFNPTNNRITSSGYSYDAAGNLLNDGAHAYTFDAENKIKTVDGTTAYVYDGEGQRVRKLVAENLRFIYGISGQQIAEFSGSSGALQKEYVYGVSGLLATIEPTALNANGTRYLTSDNLGTPRVVTNSSANVISRHDYKPFGEELAAGVGGRTTSEGYDSNDGTRQKFTQKERDTETGLDYYLARYYSSIQGRFSAADPLYVEMTRLSDPQQPNLYSYVRNNSLTFSAPTGLDINVDGAKEDEYYKELQKDVSFSISKNNGKVIIVNSVGAELTKKELKALGKTLKGAEKQMFNATTDSKNHVTIHAIDGVTDSSVFFGRSDGKHTGSHTIAFGQAALLDGAKNAGGMTAAQLVGHETLEGYYESQGVAFDDAHLQANKSFAGFNQDPVWDTQQQQGNMVIGLIGNSKIAGTNVTERFTTRFNTPVPKADFAKGKGAPYKGYPVNVEKEP